MTSNYSLSILLSCLQHVTSAFVSPKGMTQYLQSLYQVLNTVFYSSPSLIYIKQYTSRRSNQVNILAPQSLFLSSFARGSIYLSLIVISLSFQQLTQSRFVPSTFQVYKTGLPALDYNSYIYPLDKLLSIYSLSVPNSSINIQQRGLNRTSLSYINSIL